MNGVAVRHVLYAKQFTREWLADFFPVAAEMKDKLTLPDERRRLHERLLGRSAILYLWGEIHQNPRLIQPRGCKLRHLCGACGQQHFVNGEGR